MALLLKIHFICKKSSDRTLSHVVGCNVTFLCTHVFSVFFFFLFLLKCKIHLWFLIYDVQISWGKYSFGQLDFFLRTHLSAHLSYFLVPLLSCQIRGSGSGAYLIINTSASQLSSGLKFFFFFFDSLIFIVFFWTSGPSGSVSDSCNSGVLTNSLKV